MVIWLYPLDMKLLKRMWSFVMLKQKEKKERLKSAKLKKIFTNEDGSSGTLYLISNDPGLDADRMYEVYHTVTN